MPQLGWVVVKMFEDPTPGAIVNLRFIQHFACRVLDATDMSDAEKQDLMYILILVGKKLVAVWQHKDRYIRIEDALVRQAQGGHPPQGGGAFVLEPSQDLFIEFDEFLVQVKSCLDHLVKVGRTVLGAKRWGIATFASNGKDVIKALRRSVPKEKLGCTNNAVFYIKRNQPWIAATVEARDKINHFVSGGIDFKFFSVFPREEGGKRTVRVPMWSPDQTVRQFMEAIWENLFRLCEDLVAAFLFFRIHIGLVLFHGDSPIGSPQSPWVVTTQDVMQVETAKPGWVRYGDGATPT